MGYGSKYNRPHDNRPNGNIKDPSKGPEGDKVWENMKALGHVTSGAASVEAVTPAQDYQPSAELPHVAPAAEQQPMLGSAVEPAPQPMPRVHELVS